MLRSGASSARRLACTAWRLGGGRGGGKAGQHVAMFVDGVQRIVRRQALHPALVLNQNRP